MFCLMMKSATDLQYVFLILKFLQLILKQMVLTYQYDIISKSIYVLLCYPGTPVFIEINLFQNLYTWPFFDKINFMLQKVITTRNK